MHSFLFSAFFRGVEREDETEREHKDYEAERQRQRESKDHLSVCFGICCARRGFESFGVIGRFYTCRLLCVPYLGGFLASSNPTSNCSNRINVMSSSPCHFVCCRPRCIKWLAVIYRPTSQLVISTERRSQASHPFSRCDCCAYETHIHTHIHTYIHTHAVQPPGRLNARGHYASNAMSSLCFCSENAMSRRWEMARKLRNTR